MTQAPGRLMQLEALWVGVIAALLWSPAVAVQSGFIFLQLIDILAFASVPFAIAILLQADRSARLLVMLFCASVLLSTLVANGVQLVAAWVMLCALPFFLVTGKLLATSRNQLVFVAVFLACGLLSALFFGLQLVVGAESLDYRNNLNFSLPPHFGRGFALFPEVSTFAAHMVIVFCACITVWLHPASDPQHKRVCGILMCVVLVALLFTRSTSVLLMVPISALIALVLTRKMTLNTLLLIILVAAGLSLLLGLFFTLIFESRVSSGSALRSASMRLSTILAGFSPLVTGEVFGVGMGQNDEITARAFDVASVLGFRFGQVPTGVNSQIVGRLFEEGYPALVQILFGVVILARSLGHARQSHVAAALFAIGTASFFCALLIIGYRGIYTNWLWLAVAIAFCTRPVRPEQKVTIPSP